MKDPKVFISYSWSSPSHERWVLDLAENLMASGIEVKLDKWDLRPGADSVAFMESMVTDKSIDKVLIISDKIYSEKADERRGGVGTETQIISKKVYEQVDQERFIAVIAEKDEEGKAYTPTFYHSRLYIDLSNPESYSGGFEELIRCIYGQPQYQKPQLGKKPDFLSKEITINLGTAPLARRAITSIKEGKNIAGAALEEYLTIFAENLERIRIVPSNDVLFDDQVVTSITEFSTSRNELLQVITSAARYLEQQETAEHLHKFLESILRYQEAPANLNGWRETDFDNYKFIIHEIFLYTITICLKYSKLVIAAQLLDKSYYVDSRRTAPYLSNYECFYKDAGTLSQRNQRLQLNRTSLSADLTNELSNTSSVDFSSLMQTDFLLFVRCEIHSGRWWPKTLVYLGHYPGAFEIFTRSSSAQYFENLKRILNVTSKGDLEQFAADATQRGGRYYGFSQWGVDWKRLMNLDDLACLP
ncbi:TIR domain-containing protein [Pseudomonas fluorescens]|uniref:SEFIR domain-containing protein n=1 Tax=Pseudomonas fluorescens TaxID=294 RepID=UPI003523470B